MENSSRNCNENSLVNRKRSNSRQTEPTTKRIASDSAEYSKIVEECATQQENIEQTLNCLENRIEPDHPILRQLDLMRDTIRTLNQRLRDQKVELTSKLRQGGIDRHRVAEELARLLRWTEQATLISKNANRLEMCAEAKRGLSRSRSPVIPYEETEQEHREDAQQDNLITSLPAASVIPCDREKEQEVGSNNEQSDVEGQEDPSLVDDLRNKDDVVVPMPEKEKEQEDTPVERSSHDPVDVVSFCAPADDDNIHKFPTGNNTSILAGENVSTLSTTSCGFSMLSQADHCYSQPVCAVSVPTTAQAAIPTSMENSQINCRPESATPSVAYPPMPYYAHLLHHSPVSQHCYVPQRELPHSEEQPAFTSGRLHWPPNATQPQQQISRAAERGGNERIMLRTLLQKCQIVPPRDLEYFATTVDTTDLLKDRF